MSPLIFISLKRMNDAERFLRTWEDWEVLLAPNA